MKERFQNILCPMGRTAGRGIALLAAGGLVLGMFVGCSAPVPQEGSSPEVQSQAVDGAPSQEEIAQLLATSNGQAPTDGWVFPLKGQEDCFLSAAYGWRNQATDFHTGADLVKKGEDFYGEEILAANAGKVVFVKDSVDEPGQGYGKYVVLDHGGSVTTLYAQCSEILVAQGDEVTAGQPIAKVGSTGYSTGPHLHFELRKEGSHCDPLQLYAPVEKVETAVMAGHLASYLTGKTGEKVTADQLEEGRLEEIHGVSAYAYRLGEEGYAIASREEGGFSTYRYDPQAGEWQGMDLFFPF